MSSQASCAAPAELTSQTPAAAVQMSVSGQKRRSYPPCTSRLMYRDQAKPECTSAVQLPSPSDTSRFFLVLFASKFQFMQPKSQLHIHQDVFTALFTN